MFVDFCAYLGNWPLYQLPLSNAADLVRVMDRCGIDVAFVSAIDGLFLLDPREANERLRDLAAGHRDRLLPVGVLNPTLPFWRDDLADGIRRLDLAGFRLHPFYHGYELDSSLGVAVASALAEYQRPLFVAACIDEERFQHPAIRVPPIPVTMVANLIRFVPQTTIVLNNLTIDEATILLQEPGLRLDNVFIDISSMDKPFDGLVHLVGKFGSTRLVYGSQVPFLYPEATLALVEASDLPEEDIRAIFEDNWRRSDVLCSRMANRGR